MTTTKELFTSRALVVCLLFAVAPATHSGVQTGQEELDTLIEAACQARRPSLNMRVQWVLETGKPTMLNFERRNMEMPEQAPAETIDFSATLSDTRSRIETVQKTYESGDRTKDASLIQDSTAVFDGEVQRRLRQPIKGFSEKPVGWQYYDDKNSSELLVRLWDWPFDLCDPKARERHSLEMVHSENPNIHTIDAILANGWRYRFTIDGAKNFNVTKIECIRTNGDYDWINEYTMSQHADGTWYMNGWEQTRWPFVGEEGEPYVEWRAKVTSVEFDIEVPDETFKLEFPPGIKVYDRILDDWVTAGSSGQMLLADDWLDEPIRTAGLGTAEPNHNRPEEGEVNAPQAVAQTTKPSTEPEEPQHLPLAEAPSARKPVVWFLVVVGIVAVCMAGLYAARAKRRSSNV